METKVTELISEHFGIPVAEINSALELRKDLNATDLEIADFFMALEGAFHLTITPADAVTLQTIGDLTSYISDHAEDID